jgi:hypothetical protein
MRLTAASRSRMGRSPSCRLRPEPPTRSSAHTIVAADVSPEEVADRLDSSDLGAPMSPRFLHWLSGRLNSEPGSLDAVFGALGVEEASGLKLRSEARLRDHPRAARAARYRSDVGLFADPEERAIVAVGRGSRADGRQASRLNPGIETMAWAAASSLRFAPW